MKLHHCLEERLIIPKASDLDSAAKRQRRYIDKHYPGFADWLQNKYQFCESWNEMLYNYINRPDSTSRPICPVCSKPVNYFSTCGYTKFCSCQCSNSNPETRDKFKQTNLEKYGVENPFQSDVIKNKIKLRSEAIKNKVKQTNLERYGVENPFQSDKIKDKIKQTNLERYGTEHASQSEIIKNKVKQTNLERYGVENPSQSDAIKNKVKRTFLDKYGVGCYSQSKEYQSRRDEIRNKIKQTNIEKYGSEYYTQSQEFQNRHGEIQNKANDTKRQNHTFNTSRIEKDFELYLKSRNIEYKTQYGSELYPFNCDFYLPKYDLYIEIQAGWFHGHHPYDPESDKEILESWKSKNTKYYDNAIETWTIRDVKKRNFAKQNHLNYLEIFSNNINEVTSLFEEQIKKEEP